MFGLVVVVVYCRRLCRFRLRRLWRRLWRRLCLCCCCCWLRRRWLRLRWLLRRRPPICAGLAPDDATSGICSTYICDYYSTAEMIARAIIDCRLSSKEESLWSQPIIGGSGRVGSRPEERCASRRTGTRVSSSEDRWRWLAGSVGPLDRTGEA